MMQINRVKRKPVAEINVVPYIDVMLVLLIIFMVTAPLVTQGVKVDLPQASAEPLDQDSKPPIIASINAKGEYFLATGSENGDPMSVTDLATVVAARLQLDPDTPVIVKADRSIEYNYVIELMTLLQRAGAPSVGLMTEPKQ
ncbi:protein TolR [Psychrosphaera saromensis]|uniref:Tol-Pal system protein TolR n=1 Tax=Psychrosphaera saromensis TaxID=716813 RepID=A0A2S7V031_9GAMM|nr:protein TolR [Psychrosphaera saromensis]PQJ54880.1 protein TolR [Psychrosphaera saromensis]GHB56414.1 protein TolR [Psychrosphaera saromensis]GLQ13877.1 protein TolR [Psychrosphaera saromensis]